MSLTLESELAEEACQEAKSRASEARAAAFDANRSLERTNAALSAKSLTAHSLELELSAGRAGREELERALAAGKWREADLTGQLAAAVARGCAAEALTATAEDEAAGLRPLIGPVPRASLYII